MNNFELLLDFEVLALAVSWITVLTVPTMYVQINIDISVSKLTYNSRLIVGCIRKGTVWSSMIVTEVCWLGASCIARY